MHARKLVGDSCHTVTSRCRPSQDTCGRIETDSLEETRRAVPSISEPAANSKHFTNMKLRYPGTSRCGRDHEQCQ